MNCVSLPLPFILVDAHIEGLSLIILLSLPGSIRSCYQFHTGLWMEYHSPSKNILTEKMSAIIGQMLRKRYPKFSYPLKYSINKFLLSKEIFNQNAIPYELFPETMTLV